MSFTHLCLKAIKKQKKERAEHLPVYTPNAYLRRKQIESQAPLKNRSFYLCRMIEEYLKGIDIDGSGKITICAHQVHTYPVEVKYICDRHFHVSIYYIQPVL